MGRARQILRRGWRTSVAVAVLSVALLAATEGRASSTPWRPAPCWLLDSPQAAYVSGGGLSLLQQACAGPVPGPQEAGSAQLSGATPASGGFNVQLNDSSQDTPPRTTQNETAISICGSRALAAWNDTGAPPGAYTGYARSLDGGEHWADGGTVPGVSGSDPALAADSQCRFYFAAIAFIDGCGAIGVARSDNGGVSWGPFVSASRGTPCANFQDKEGLAVDNTTGPFSGSVYVCWDDRGPDGIRLLFSRSTDAARSFSAPQTLATFAGGFATGCQVAVAPDGRVHVVWTGANDLRLAIRTSSDGGATFSSRLFIQSTVLNGDFGPCGASEVRPRLNGEIRTFNWPAFAVNPLTGSLHLAWNDGRSGNPDILYVRSTDGVAWTAPVRLNDDSTTTDQFQPAIAFTPQGVLRAVWYDRRLDPGNNFLIDVYSTVSAGNGQAFSQNGRLTDVSFRVPPLNPNFDPAAFPCYMGDYIGIAGADGRHLMAWGDNRNTVQGHPDPDVFYDSISVLALGDVDCDFDIDARDGLQVLRAAAGLGVSAVCLETSADTDCDGDADAADAVAILAFAAGVRRAPAPGCRHVGG